MKTDTPFARWIADARQQVARQQTSSNLDAEQQAAIERRIGRPLTREELFLGEIKRSDNRSFAEAMAHGNWQPVMPKSDAHQLDAMIAEAEQAVRDEQYKKLSPAERQVFQLKEIKLKQQREAATKAEYEARMADPKVQAALAKLETIKAKAAFDPSWTVSDMVAIEKAILQLTTPGADVAVGIDLTKEALGVAKSKQDAVAAKVRERQAGLEQELAALNGDFSLDFESDDSQKTQQPANKSKGPSAAWTAEETKLSETFRAAMAKMRSEENAETMAAAEQASEALMVYRSTKETASAE